MTTIKTHRTRVRVRGSTVTGVVSNPAARRTDAMSVAMPQQDRTGIGLQRPLAGQTALVTGAASGIGAGVARALAVAGAAVVVNYVTGAEQAEAVVGEIHDAGGTAMAVRADVSREDDVQAMFRTTLQAWDGLDILVSNAGIQKDAAVTDMTLAQWNAVLGVNLTGTFLCAREAARTMIRQGIRPGSRAAGKIVCISSVHEAIPWAGHVNYAASKGGVKLFMQSLAQELAPHRIRVNSVAPGAIQTPINRPAWETPQALASLLTPIPYGRIGQPADIGNAVVWMASDAADYVHGQTLFVDGGMTLYPEFARGG
jgi:glucose 1-dehydrogenase